MSEASVKKAKFGVQPWMTGLVVGVGAAAAEAYFGVFSPVGNGLCLICHPRDFFDWIANHLFGLEWPVSLISSIYPIMTVVGVVLGAAVAARVNGEMKVRPTKGAWKYLIYGFLAINFGLLVTGCPIRIVLLAAYGSPMGFAGWAAIGIGVVSMTLIVRWYVRRAAATQGGSQ